MAIIDALNAILPLDARRIWIDAWVLLLVAIASTIVPILRAVFETVKLQKPTAWFDTANQFPEDKQRLIDHEARIIGTLNFWKNQATQHSRINTARILWSLCAAVTLPLLIQLYDKSEIWANVFLTTLTLWTGFIVSLAHTLKSEEKFRGYRQCESDYYDVSRALLDNPAETTAARKKQVTEYLSRVASIRALGRDVETGTPPSAIRR
jgi:hypothetical protein